MLVDLAHLQKKTETVWGKCSLLIYRIIATCIISLWKFLAYHGKINVVKDKVLYSRFFADVGLTYVTLTKNFGYECLDRMSNVLEKHGDFDCLINGYFHMYGKTKSCGKKSQTYLIKQNLEPKNVIFFEF